MVIKLVGGVSWHQNDLNKLKKNDKALYDKVMSNRARATDNKLIAKAIRINNPKGYNKHIKAVKAEILEDKPYEKYQEKARKWDIFVGLAKEENQCRSRIKQIAQERAKLLGITNKYKVKK